MVESVSLEKEGHPLLFREKGRKGDGGHLGGREGSF